MFPVNELSGVSSNPESGSSISAHPARTDLTPFQSIEDASTLVRGSKTVYLIQNIENVQRDSRPRTSTSISLSPETRRLCGRSRMDGSSCLSEDKKRKVPR